MALGERFTGRGTPVRARWSEGLPHQSRTVVARDVSFGRREGHPGEVHGVQPFTLSTVPTRCMLCIRKAYRGGTRQAGCLGVYKALGMWITLSLAVRRVYIHMSMISYAHGMRTKVGVRLWPWIDGQANDPDNLNFNVMALVQGGDDF